MDLGQGATSTVVALDEGTAVKIFKGKRDHLHGLDAISEIAVLQACRGFPHIVQPRPGTRMPTSVCRRDVFMERADGDLEHALEAGVAVALPLAERFRWLGQIARGLAFLHSRGFIHRDVASKNVLLFPGGVLKLTDFGMVRFQSRAEVFSGRRKMSSHLGSAIYAAPELLFVCSDYNDRVDTWSFGMLSFEVLTGGTHLLEMEGAYDANSEREENLMIGVLRSIYRVHPSRLSVIDLNFVFPSRGHSIEPGDAFEREPRRHPTWRGWFLEAYRGTGEPDMALMEDYLSSVLRLSPVQRPSMIEVARFACLRGPTLPSTAVPIAPWPALGAGTWEEGCPALALIRRVGHSIASDERQHDTIMTALDIVAGSSLPRTPDLALAALFIATAWKRGAGKEDLTTSLYSKAGRIVPNPVLDPLIDLLLDGLSLEPRTTVFDVATLAARGSVPPTRLFLSVLAHFSRLRTVEDVEQLVADRHMGLVAQGDIVDAEAAREPALVMKWRRPT